MKYSKLFGAALAIGLTISGPSAYAKEKKLTPLELQSIQAREFEVSKDDAFASVMTVIQDMGYTVDSADVASGFISASSPTVNKTNFLGAMVGMSASGNTRMTAFMQRMPNKMTRIRLNFVNSKNSSSAYGRNSAEDKPILEAKVYSNAWDKIDEALFVYTALNEGPAKPSTKVDSPQTESPADAGAASNPK